MNAANLVRQHFKRLAVGRSHRDSRRSNVEMYHFMGDCGDENLVPADELRRNRDVVNAIDHLIMGIPIWCPNDNEFHVLGRRQVPGIEWLLAT